MRFQPVVIVNDDDNGRFKQIGLRGGIVIAKVSSFRLIMVVLKHSSTQFYTMEKKHNSRLLMTTHFA